MQTQYPASVETARDYYNSKDADNFYHTIWGGEDIHIGIYESDDESIFDASRRTVAHLASIPDKIDPSTRVLDMGSGYAGTARRLAREFGCEVTALNLSERENARAREMNVRQDLEHLIDVVDGSFEDVPSEDSTFDVVWSQDSLLHSGNRSRVVREAARVLTPRGEFVFTDPMQSDSCPLDVLQPILDRIHLEDLGSPGFYRKAGMESGFDEISFVDLTHELVTHYTRVLEETEAQESELEKVVSQEYITNMKKGLRHWIDGGDKGHIAWGVFHCRMP